MSHASPPLHVTIDYSSAITHSAGIARYTRELVTALQSRPNEVQLRLVHHRVKQPTIAVPDALQRRELPFHMRGWRLFCLLAPQYAARRVVDDSAIDVFHAPDYVAPRLDAPIVLTIHDLTCLTHPQHHSRFNRLYQQLSLPGVARRAARILADSEHTASEISRLLGIASERITVAYPGIRGDRFMPVAQNAAQHAVKSSLGIQTPYLLGLGTVEPRKNLPALLRAFARIADQTSHDLVLVGATGWGDLLLHELANDLGIRSRVHFTGFVADDLLPALYSAADAFVFPSLYEGFGFPVLEAMACGTPVVCSDNSSLPEVGGDAALYANAADPDTFAGQLRRLLQSAELAGNLRTLGLQQAARFTWQLTASRVIGAYRLAAHAPSSEGATHYQPWPP